MAASERPDDIADLTAKVRDGDEAALAELLTRYEGRLRTTARVLLGPLLRPHLDSVDLVQSVQRILLPALREGKYDLSDTEQLIALAVTLIRRKVARQWRHLRREHRLQTLARMDGILPKDIATPSPAPDPARTAELKDDLGHLFNLLKDDERRLIELRLQGFGTPKIAARLGYDAHVLHARLSRLRQRLRDLGYQEWF
jgi:RNA polymerase sigma-70 factor (ECF subfamily)